MTHTVGTVDLAACRHGDSTQQASVAELVRRMAISTPTGWSCLLKCLVAACVAATVVDISNGQTLDTPSLCYAANRCTGLVMGGAPTVEECCTERNGLGFVVDGEKLCFPCIVYGFNTTQIVAVEREERYGADIVVEKGEFDLNNARPSYDLRLVGGTATEGEDFTFENIQIQFSPATGPYPTVFFTFIPDGIAREGRENFILELVQTGGRQQVWYIFTNRIELIIVDGDIPSVNITLVETDIVVQENELREVCVAAIQNDFTRSIPVQIMFTDGTAIGNLDYIARVVEVMISPESNFTGCFNLSVIDDDAFEFDEDFTFSINTTDDHVFINTRTARVTLQDDDLLVIGWNQTEYSGIEGGVITACVALNVGAGGLEVTLPPINVSSSDGTALQDIDYVPISEDLTFTEGSPGTMCVQVSLLDNSEFVPLVTEFFSLDLTFPNLDRVEIGRESARVNIEEDEEIIIGFEEETYTFTEQNSGTDNVMGSGSRVDLGSGLGSGVDTGSIESVCVEVSGGTLGRDVTVNVLWTPGTATLGADYNTPSTQYTLLAGTDRQCVDVNIISDSLLERPEDFTGELQGFVIDGNSLTSVDGITLDPDTTLVEIADNDTILVGFEQASYTFSEPEFIATQTEQICMELITGNIGEAYMFAVLWNPITATTGSPVTGSDYIPESAVYEFAPGVRRSCIDIFIFGDDRFELREGFNGQITSVLPSADRVNIRTSFTQVFIEDVDAVTIGFEEPTYTASEPNSGSGVTILEVCMEVSSGVLGREVVIIPTVASGTALGGEDFDTVLDIAYTFAAGSTRSCQDFFIFDHDDSLFELTEDFSIEVRGILDPDGVEVPAVTGITVTPSKTQVFILDSDDVTIEFQTEDVTVSESDGSFTACLTKNNNSAVTFNVTVSSIADSALNGTDFLPEAIPSVITILPEENEVCFTAVGAIVDDVTALEATVSFSLKIDQVEPFDMARVIIGRDTLKVSIVDDDGLDVGFVDNATAISEDEGDLSVCIFASSGDFIGDVTLMLAYLSMTAQEDSDYQPSEQTVVFRPPSVEECFSVAIINDNIHEGLETFSVSLSSPDGRITVSVPSIEVSIGDDDILVVGILDSFIEAPENVGAVEICVNSTEFVGSMEIPISYTGSTAQEGSDFTIINNTLILTEGSLEVCFDVDIVDDAVYEDLKGDFIVELLPLGMVVYSQQSALVSILDDDNVYIEFSSDNYTALETQESVMICITRSAVFEPASFTIDVSLSDVTAISGQDYEGGNYLVSFSFDTDPMQCFNVTILNDDEREEQKMFVANFDLFSFPDSRIMLGARTNVTVTIVDPSFSALVEVNVNDTVSGDPVLTVPIFVSEEQLANISASQLSLCYEVHGKSDKWFNLVSDECASVNAHYIGISDNLNVIDEIAIRTTDSQSRCVNISVRYQNGCLAFVNDVETSRYSVNGVSVRTYANRVRISAPNCNELTLVMWVSCGEQDFLVGEGSGMMTQLTERTIKFVVMRGLNYGHRLAHGLLGQFWNIPVSIKPFTGENVFGQRADDTYIVNITTISQQRLYVGVLGHLTWEVEEGPCLYVGDSQSDSTYEFADPNDRVIEGLYTDYIVSGSFNDDFKFGLFDEEKCEND